MFIRESAALTRSQLLFAAMIKTTTSLFLLTLAVLDLHAATVGSANGNLRVEVLPGGSYSVMIKEPNWTLQGQLPSVAADIAVGQAQDPSAPTRKFRSPTRRLAILFTQ
jgi:hypothetical protein